MGAKSHVDELSQIWALLVKDACQIYPTLEVEFERDLIRLHAMVEARGIRLFLADLPAIGKHFDRCLADGEYNRSELPLTGRYSNRVVIPKFLRGLYLLVFNPDGSLRKTPDTEAIFFLRQLFYVGKKVVFPCPDHAVDDAVKDFVDIEAALPELDKFWSSTGPALEEDVHWVASRRSVELFQGARSESGVLNPGLDEFAAMFDKVSNIVSSTLGVYNPEHWNFRHGPGAISETVGPTNKYSWTNWSDTLESVYPISEYGFHSYSAWAHGVSSRSISSHEPKSRLISVPKTFKGPRLIAAEPSEHQWCQQNIWHFMRSRVESSWIGEFAKFGDQTFSQGLCLKGSLEGELATLDLSSASDRLTCALVAQMFRSNTSLLLALRATRTRRITQLVNRKLPSELVLKKFSTMGSACTFPVQTLVFLTVAIAATLVKRKLNASVENIRSLAGTVSVFGDDIIVPVECRELVVSALEALCLKVNTSKSFWNGKFRESCGTDAYAGVDVTPVYWKGPNDGKPASLSRTVDTRNNFYKKWLLNVADYLESTLPRQLPVVGARGAGIGGLQDRCGASWSHLKMRYSESLHRDEVLVWTLSTVQPRDATNDDSAIFQFFTELPDPHTSWVHGVSQRPQLRKKMRWVPVYAIAAQR